MSLRPPEEWREELLHRYYVHLGQDDGFLQSLQELFRRLSPLADRHTPEWGSWPELPGVEALAAWVTFQRGREEIEPALQAFARAWPLPPDAVPDLWAAFWRHRQRGEVKLERVRRQTLPPELRGSLEPQPPPWGYPWVWLPAVTEARRAELERLAEFPARFLVLPGLPSLLTYDPTRHDRQWLNEQIDALCSKIRSGILEQAEELEQQAKAEGWRPTPPPYSTPAVLQETARMLYLRAVKRWSWNRIAAQTGAKSRTATIKRVKHAAKITGVPL